jgi:hypothetical protein
MVYSVGAVERAMTIHQALLHALHGRQTWLQVADVIGLTRRALAMARPIPGFPTPVFPATKRGAMLTRFDLV